MKKSLYLDTIAMHDDLLSGKELCRLQKESDITVMALSRLTGLSRSSIYRAFDDESQIANKVLIRVALTNPEIFTM